MLQLSQFVWTLRSSAQVVLNNSLLIDATVRSKISSNQKRLFFAVSLYPLSFFANTPFKTLNELSFLQTLNFLQRKLFFFPNDKMKMVNIIYSDYL